MHPNGQYNSLPVLNDYNLIGRTRKNKPLQNATQPLVKTFQKVAVALSTTMNSNSPSWIQHAVGYISVSSKLPTLRFASPTVTVLAKLGLLKRVTLLI